MFLAIWGFLLYANLYITKAVLLLHFFAGKASHFDLLRKPNDYRTHVTVAVPCVRLADNAAALHTDRGHSLRSLLLPQAALGDYSHSIVPMGFGVRSRRTRLMPSTS